MENAAVNRQISYSEKRSEQPIRPKENSARASVICGENGFKQQVLLLKNLSEKIDDYFSVTATRFRD
jgi:hypothetical protein